MPSSNILKNFIFNSSYQILLILLPLITAPYISRTIGVNGIGMYTYTYSIAYYFYLFAMSGLSNYGNRTIAMSMNKIEESKNFIGIYIVQLTMTVISIVAYLIFLLFVCDEKYKILFLIQLFFVMSSGFDINWFFFGIEEFKLTVSRNFFIKIVSTLSIFVFVKNQNDLYIYAFILAFSTFISQLLLFPFLKERLVRVRIEKKDIIRHIKPNLYLFIPTLAISIYKMMDKTMLGMISPISEVGYYENSQKLVEVPLAFINALGTTMMPRITKMTKIDKVDTTKIFNYTALFSLFIASSFSFGIMAVSKEFIILFYGSNFEKCIDLLKILMPICIFSSITTTLRTQYLIPLKKDRTFLISVVLGALVNLILNLLLIPRYYSIGASIATISAEIMVCGFLCFSSRYDIKYKYLIQNGIVIICSAFFMYITLLDFDFKNLSDIKIIICKIVLGIIIYLVYFLCFMLIKKIFIFIKNKLD